MLAITNGGTLNSGTTTIANQPGSSGTAAAATPRVLLATLCVDCPGQDACGQVVSARRHLHGEVDDRRPIALRRPPGARADPAFRPCVVG